MKLYYVIHEIDSNTYITLFTTIEKAENFADSIRDNCTLLDICDSETLIDTEESIHIN
jgi:hypothetical protein